MIKVLRFYNKCLVSAGHANFKVTVLRDLWSDSDVQTGVEEPSTYTFSQVPLLRGFATSRWIDVPHLCCVDDT